MARNTRTLSTSTPKVVDVSSYDDLPEVIAWSNNGVRETPELFVSYGGFPVTETPPKGIGPKGRAYHAQLVQDIKEEKAKGTDVFYIGKHIQIRIVHDDLPVSDAGYSIVKEY